MLDSLDWSSNGIHFLCFTFSLVLFSWTVDILRVPPRGKATLPCVQESCMQDNGDLENTAPLFLPCPWGSLGPPWPSDGSPFHLGKIPSPLWLWKCCESGHRLSSIPSLLIFSSFHSNYTGLFAFAWTQTCTLDSESLHMHFLSKYPGTDMSHSLCSSV